MSDNTRENEQLLAELTTLQNLVENVPVGIYRTTPAGRILMLNKAGLRMIGFSSMEEVKDLNIDDVPFGPGYDRAEFNRRIEREGEVRGLEAEWTLRDGSKAVFRENVRTVRGDDGSVLYFEGTLEDISERMQAEAALRESEEKFRSLSDAADEGIVIHDQGVILEVNQAFAEMTGYTPLELIGKNALEISSPETRDLALRNLMSGSEVSYEGIGVRKDGSRFHGELSTKNVRYMGRDARVAIIRDVTDQKRAEQELRESERRYRLLAENVTDVIFMADLDLGMTYVSPSVEGRRGFTPDEVVRQSPEEIHTPQSLQAIRRLMRTELKRDGEPGVDPRRHHTVISEQYHKDGSTIWTENIVGFLRDDRGRPTGILGVSRDITKRKEAEDALRQSEERYRLVADHVSDVIFTLGLDLKVTYMSPSVTRYSGFSADELVGTSIENRMSKESLLLIGNVLREELEREGAPGVDPRRARTVELELLAKEGTSIWAETAVTFLRDKDLNPIGIQGIARDITDRKRAEEEKARLHSQLHLTDKMTTVGQLAAGIAHEINNPVAFILPNLQSLKEHLGNLVDLLRLYRNDAPKSEIAEFEQARKIDLFLDELPRMLSDCLSGAERIRGTTRELRQFARTDETAASKVSLSELIDSSLVMATNEIKYRARVQKEYTDLPPVSVSRGRMGQVFLNIILNGAQSIEEGHVEENWIRVRTGQEDGEVFAEIANSGPPIPDDVLPRIFDPFFSTKPMGQGTGLGLSIAYSTVQQHGGRIEVESNAELGTVFRIWLPMEAEAPGPARTAEPSTVPGRSGRILLIDDEEGIVKSMGRILRSAHTVVTAGSGKEALALLAADPAFDLILCDLMMSEISGMDVYEAVERNQPELVERFAFMTGGVFTQRAQSFLQRVEPRLFEKPIEPDDLLRLVGEAMAAGQH